MKTLLKTLALSLALFFGTADAQTAFPLFQPSDGIMVGDENTFVTTSATSSDVITLWSGTCDPTTFLRGDGSCQIVTSVSPANPTASLGLTAINGVAATFMRSDGAPALSQSITPTWSGQHIFSNTTGAGAVLLSSTAPLLGWQETDGAANNQRWRIGPTAETWRLEAVNDAVSAATTAILVDRTGTTIDSVAITATTATVNGSNICRADGTGCPVNGAGGSTTQMQYNNAGALGGASTFIFDGTSFVYGGGTALSVGNVSTTRFQQEGTDTASASHSLVRDSASNAGPIVKLGKTRSAGLGGSTIVQSGDQLGSFIWYGADGTNLASQAVSIQAFVDGTPGTGDMPGSLAFLTTADGAASTTERLRIKADGSWSVGTAGTNVGSSGQVLTSNGAGSAPTWQASAGTPGGSTTQVQFNNAGAFGGDAGMTYVAGTDTLSVGTVTAATAVTVAGQNVCQANGTNCPAAGGTTLPIRSISVSDNTASTDCGKVIVFTGAGSQTFTLDADPVANCVLTFINNGSAAVSLAASTLLTWFNGSGSNQTGTRSIAVGGVMTCTVFATPGTWQTWGSGVL
jgi:hypothetical protein